jgi:hypothetical protein
MDRSRLSRRAAALLLLAVAAGCGSEDTGGALDTDGSVPIRPGISLAPAGSIVLTADLSGAEEVPGPGAKDGTGTAHLTFTPDGKVCVDLATSKVDAATAAHVHTGAKGVAGPVVITLPTPKDGRASECVNADKAAAAKVTADPASAYVNIHTAALPNGAVRGQLTKV